MQRPYCSLALRSYFNIAETSGRCAIAMFVDVIGAFDALIRRFVSDERADDIRVIAIIQQLGLPPSVMHDFVESLSEASISILPSLGVSAHLAAIIEDALSCTWHTVQGCEEMTEPVTGCKPGDPLADMLFCFLMIKVLRKIEADLKNAGISFVMPPLKAVVAATVSFHSNDDELTHSDATYADDSVFMSQLTSPIAVLPMAHDIAGIVVRAMLSFPFGQTPNETKLSSSSGSPEKERSKSGTLCIT